jgi:hypothetical protein
MTNTRESPLAFQKIADCRLDAITGETIGGFIASGAMLDLKYRL